MKLAVIALLIHPLMILFPTGAICGDKLGTSKPPAILRSRMGFFANHVSVLFRVGE